MTAGAPYWIMVLTSGSLHIADETPTVTWQYQTGVAYGSLPATVATTALANTHFGDLYFVTAP